MVSSFNDLDQSELYRAAIEDFAVEVNEGDSAEVIRAALFESGVTWEKYVEGHPELAPVVAKKADRHTKKPAGVISTTTLTDAPVVRTAEAPVQEPTALYLVKMNRENPYFEFGKYKFTSKKPFAVMDAESTNAILTEEVGFSIATPAEAQEYYS
jgi:hypothetical protein